MTDALDDFEPNLIVATADKNFPAFLADYGNTNHIEVVNVFDVKNELFEDNPSMVQILPRQHSSTSILPTESMMNIPVGR